MDYNKSASAVYCVDLIFYCTRQDQFEKKLKDSMEKDLRFMTTNVGPHRDDLSFFNGDVDLRKYGSQGQQRTCALSLSWQKLSW